MPLLISKVNTEALEQLDVVRFRSEYSVFTKKNPYIIIYIFTYTVFVNMRKE